MSFEITAFPFSNEASGQEDWQDMFRNIRVPGVLSAPDFHNPDALGELEVSASGASMSVDIASGLCWIDGNVGKNPAADSLSIDPSDPTNPRIDRVIARLNRLLNTMNILVLKGTAAGSPAAPTLTISTYYYEIALAQVRVNAGVSVIAASAVTDERNRLFQGKGSPFGDGSDGNVTISTTVTLTRDMQYNDLRILNGGILKPAGFLVQVAGLLKIDSGGAINGDGNDGGNATGSTPGTAGTAPYTVSPHWPPGSAGGAGGNPAGAGTINGSVGTAGGVNADTATPVPWKLKTGGGGSGGAGHGVATPTTSGNGGDIFAGFIGAAGKSGSGAASVDQAGGGGGGGAGVMEIWARFIDNAGTISCNGGNGGNGAGSSAGGGGGGAGGMLSIFYRTAQGSGLGTRTATGGTNGANGTGGGTAQNGVSQAWQI